MVGRADRQDLRAAAELPRAVVADLHREVDLAAAQRGDARVVLEDLELDGVDRAACRPSRSSLATKESPAWPRFSLSLNGPVPFIFARPVARLREVGGQLVALRQDDRLVGHLAEQVREERRSARRG